ncbi:MAG: indolepyruvate oxidoreductase subunit beta [Spirochaetia bacterium]|jgi:indolepyruvate ferredoxin oxidoreductase beta subunit|nr:indolepyruvate oxidoreductase subunit beta [Spirochaetia bacterium]
MSEKIDIILSGVGGQGVLSVGAIVSMAAMKEGFKVRQSEVHGMAQRGGAVLAHLRISTDVIESDLIPRGGADVVLSMEPLESLRYVNFLKPDGVLITASEPVENISDYPDPEKLYRMIKGLSSSRLIETKALAKEAGSQRAVNMVLVGALSPYLPFKPEAVETAIKEKFTSKGEDVVAVNLEAFRLGKENGGMK